METVSLRLLVSISPYVEVSSEMKITKSLLTHRIVNNPTCSFWSNLPINIANRRNWTKTMIFSEGASRSQLCTCCFKVWSFVVSGIGILFYRTSPTNANPPFRVWTPMKSLPKTFSLKNLKRFFFPGAGGLMCCKSLLSKGVEQTMQTGSCMIVSNAQYYIILKFLHCPSGMQHPLTQDSQNFCQQFAMLIWTGSSIASS